MCFFCGKPKNEIALLGAAGDELIKSMGRKVEDGLPMYMHLDKDYTPCDTCKNSYVGIVAIDPLNKVHKGVWQVTRDAFASWEFLSANTRNLALEHGVAFVTPDVATKLGLFRVTARASERDKNA